MATTWQPQGNLKATSSQPQGNLKATSRQPHVNLKATSRQPFQHFNLFNSLNLFVANQNSRSHLLTISGLVISRQCTIILPNSQNSTPIVPSKRRSRDTRINDPLSGQHRTYPTARGRRTTTSQPPASLTPAERVFLWGRKHRYPKNLLKRQ